MENIFDKPAWQNIMSRVDNLHDQSSAQWGKMNVGQMVHHCQAPLNIILGKNDYNLKPNWFAKVFFKKSLYSDKPWRKNLPTIKPFKETEERSFDIEREKLKMLLHEIGGQRDREEWGEHPAFGKFSKEQWGKMQYKHLDHHLRQFGV